MQYTREETGFWEGLDKKLFQTSVLTKISEFDRPFRDKNISNVHTALIQIFFGKTDLLDELGFLNS